MAYIPLHTARLHLRALEESDADVVLFLRGNEEMNRYISRTRPQTKADALAFIARISGEITENKIYYWAITPAGLDGMIGSICLWNFSSDQKTAEVGYDLHPDHRGQGVMREALQRILLFGVGDLGLETIEAFTHRNNAPSIGLLENCGFKIDAHREDADNTHNAIYIKKSDSS